LSAPNPTSISVVTIGAPARRSLATSLSEAELLANVLGLSRLRGFRTAHFRPGRTSDGSWRTPVEGDAKGFPDLVIIGFGRLVVAELKSQAGKLAPEQAAWLRAWADTGAETYLWRPSDWLSGQIEAILAPMPVVAVTSLPINKETAAP